MSRIREAIAAIFDDQKEIGAINQTKLARAIGCRPGYVSLLLSGQRRLNEDLIEKMCDALGVTLSDLDKPLHRPEEPKELREYCAKLKRLRETSPDRAFRSCTRMIDDWLEAAETQSSVNDGSATETEGKEATGGGRRFKRTPRKIG